MAANRRNDHILTRHTLYSAPGRARDREYASEKEIVSIMIWAAGAITRIGKRLNSRQFVIATAIMYFRRFYVKNALAETDPCLVAAACVYVATKSEEAPIHIKTVVEASRNIFGDYSSALGPFPTDASLVAEMEFYLISDLDYHLMIWHPYRDLVMMTGKEDDSLPKDAESKPDEWLPQPGSFSYPGYQAQMKRKEQMMAVDREGFQTAWAVISDTYRSDICLLYPPYLIALGALYMSLVMHPPPIARPAKGLPGRTSSSFTFSAPSTVSTSSGPSTSRRTTTDDIDPSIFNSYVPTLELNADTVKSTRLRTCPIEFFARLPISLTLILEVVQEVVALYELWNTLELEAQFPPSEAAHHVGAPPSAMGTRTFVPLGTMEASGSKATAPASTADDRAVAVLVRMRRERERDLAHP